MAIDKQLNRETREIRPAKIETILQRLLDSVWWELK